MLSLVMAQKAMAYATHPALFQTGSVTSPNAHSAAKHGEAWSLAEYWQSAEGIGAPKPSDEVCKRIAITMA